MMEQAGKRRIVIVGGGTAGWMAAAALARFCANSWSITLVESDDIGTIGVGEATIPGIRNFNNALGIDEREFLASTAGTYKLGITFEGWSGPDEGYIHAFGLLGRSLGILPFHHYWLRARKLGIAKPLPHYVLNAVASGLNRFAQVERPAGSMLPPMPYAFHFDASLYARFLRRYAEDRGVVRREGLVREVVQDPGSGDVTQVNLADGGSVAGDLFVDCSGFRGLLIEQTLSSGFEDWSHWLPCNRAVAVPCERTSPLVPYTRSTARQAGWQWRIPLQHRTGNGHVFAIEHISEDEATAVLLANLDGQPTAEPRVIRFATGKRREAWKNNVVAIGLAAGFIEPLESTSIHLIQTAINRLLDFLPNGDIAAADRDRYNRLTDFEITRIRDFVVLHYYANGRVGEPFWDAVRAMEIPDTLKAKMDMFRAYGRVVREGDELFDVPGWVQVMIGQHVDPASYHPVADELSEAKLGEFLTAVETACSMEAARMPEHSAFVADYAPIPGTGSAESPAEAQI